MKPYRPRHDRPEIIIAVTLGAIAALVSIVAGLVLLQLGQNAF